MEDTRTRISYPSEIVKADIFKPQSSQKFSRYKSLKRIVNKNGDSFIETPNKFVIRETTSDSFYKVEAGFENRLDLISNRFYGTPKLWWAIACANKLYNPRKVPSGIILRLPLRENIPGV